MGKDDQTNTERENRKYENLLLLDTLRNVYVLALLESIIFLPAFTEGCMSNVPNSESVAKRDGPC
jgi:hypothetical protein